MLVFPHHRLYLIFLADVNSSFMQQVVQLSMQQNAQGPSLVAGPSSASLSAAILQTTSVPAASPQITSPAVQSHHPSVYLNTPTRPPNISSISPPTGNLQIGSEIRAPAPHLQPFRPATSMSTNSLPSLPRQQAPGNTATTRAAPSCLSSGSYNRGPRLETVLPNSLSVRTADIVCLSDDD